MVGKRIQKNEINEKKNWTCKLKKIRKFVHWEITRNLLITTLDVERKNATLFVRRLESQSFLYKIKLHFRSTVKTPASD